MRTMSVEERQEQGPGLFEPMDLEERGERWTPTTQHRARFAYTLDGERLRLLPELCARCPVDGYEPFIQQPDYPDGVGWRAGAGAR